MRYDYDYDCSASLNLVVAARWSSHVTHEGVIYQSVAHAHAVDSIAALRQKHTTKHTHNHKATLAHLTDDIPSGRSH